MVVVKTEDVCKARRRSHRGRQASRGSPPRHCRSQLRTAGGPPVNRRITAPPLTGVAAATSLSPSVTRPPLKRRHVTVAVGYARPELPGQSRGHCAGIDRGRCRHVTVAVGYATPPHPSGGTWGRLGHFRGVPRGSHGEKCSLSEQKGGNEHQKGPFLDEIGQIWTKSKKFRSFITEKAIF